jgi:hypothetical protein
MTTQLTEDTFSLHTGPLVMLGEHFLRERPKRLILANHLGDIRLHKQRKRLPRHLLRSWSRAHSNTMGGRTEPAGSGNLQRLPGLEREAVRWDGDLGELPPRVWMYRPDAGEGALTGRTFPSGSCPK